METNRRAAALSLAFLAAALAFALPSAAPQAFRFSILGDRTGGAVPGVYEAVWREIDALRPDFVVNVGDSIQGGDDSRANAEWRGVRAVFARYPYKLFLVPGNHDIWSEASRQAWEKNTGRPPSYSFDYGQAHFTVLDNSRTEDLPPAQLRFLEADLAANRGRSPKFVFLHRPSWLMHAVLGNTDFELHRLAKSYGVSYVVSGHVHKLARFELDGVVYLMVGSSGAALGHGPFRSHDFNSGWFYQHLLASVSAGGVQVTVKELDPPLGQGRRLDLKDWANR